MTILNVLSFNIVPLLLFASMVVADVQVEIKVLNYRNVDNKYKLDIYGNSFIYCCGEEIRYTIDKVCTQQCNPSLEIQVRDGSSNHVMETWETQSIGSNKTHDFSDESTVGNLTNPLSFNLPFWNNKYYIALRMYDGEQRNHVLSAVQVLLVNVSTDRASAIIHHVDLYNHHHQLRMQMKLYYLCQADPLKHIACISGSTAHVCSPNYYGEYCSNYCISPGPSHGRCDDNGTLICKPRFYGLNCSKTCMSYSDTSHGRCNESGVLVCDVNYYGNQCNRLCVDTKHGNCDQFGHLVCQQNYYGSKCTTFCAPVATGNCSDEGHLICAEGYTGSACDGVIDYCSPSSCSHHGTCVAVLRGVHCSCVSGWQGNHCEIDYDECQKKVCRNGLCENLPGSFKCTCANGWTGLDCDNDINECNQTEPVCQNEATCSNTPGNFTCTCKGGWSGWTCHEDVNECLDDICGVGNCTNTYGGYNCNGTQDGSIKLVFKGYLQKSDIEKIMSSLNVVSQAVCSNAIVDVKLYSITTRDDLTIFNVPVTCDGNPLSFGDIKTSVQNMADIFPNSLITSKNTGDKILTKEKSLSQSYLIAIAVGAIVFAAVVCLATVILIRRAKRRNNKKEQPVNIPGEAVARENPLYKMKLPKAGDTLA